MTRNQVKLVAQIVTKKTGVRFIPRTMVGRLLNWILKKTIRKYVKFLPDLSDKLRPCFIRIGKIEVAVLSFRPGCNGLPLAAQLEQIAHEMFHAFRIRDWVKRGGKVSGWYKAYFDPTDSDHRAIEEGGAVAAAGEIRYAIFGRTPKPPDLTSYLVSDASRKKAHAIYQTHIDEVKKLGRGGATNEVTRLMLDAMRQVGII
jgi:hypothetical protein